MKMKLALAVLSAIAISGCSSAPQKMNNIEFDSNHSYAYNIANQTALMRNDSPLRDFTQEDIEEAKTIIKNRNTGANASLVLGGLRVLTGNLSGLYSMGAGATFKLTESTHKASQPRWIVSVQADQFENHQEAQRYIADTIDKATIEYFEQFGTISLEYNQNSSIETKHIQTLTVHVNDNNYPIGVYRPTRTKEELDSKNYLMKGEKLLSTGEVYSYGFNNNLGLTSAPTALPLIINEKLTITQDEVLLAITKKLPKGFFLYMPSFPKGRYYNGEDLVTYTDYSQVVPAIYTQGEKHLFIKPE